MRTKAEVIAGTRAVPIDRFPPQDASGHDNNFNLILLVLASLVILAHSPELVDGDRHRELFERVFHTNITAGMVAVDFFFVVSGFLIVQSWQRRPVLADYLRKRILRIYPGFVVASVVAALVVGPLATTEPQAYFRHFPGGFLSGLILLREPDLPPVFAGLPYPVVNGAMWTIPHEFRCYLLVPVLGVLGLVRRRWLWLGFSGLALACFLAGPHGLNARLEGGAWSFIFPDGPAPAFQLLTFFGAGGCFYLFRSEIRYRTKWALASLPLLAICMFKGTAAYLALPTVGAYTLFWFAFLPAPRLAFFRRHADISYGVYLYGWPVQNLLIWYFPHLSPWGVFLVALPFAAAGGFLSWHLVEVPFLRRKPRHDPRDVKSVAFP